MNGLIPSAVIPFPAQKAQTVKAPVSLQLLSSRVLAHKVSAIKWIDIPGNSTVVIIVLCCKALARTCAPLSPSIQPTQNETMIQLLACLRTSHTLEAHQYNGTFERAIPCRLNPPLALFDAKISARVNSCSSLNRSL